jgi:hypothetical protein
MGATLVIAAGKRAPFYMVSICWRVVHLLQVNLSVPHIY